MHSFSLAGKLSTLPFARFKQWGEWCLFRKEKNKRTREKKHIGRSWVLWPLGFLNTVGEAESVVPVMVGGTSVFPVGTELSCAPTQETSL